MVRQEPIITMEISEILDETDQGIHVVRKQTGAPMWLPKEAIDYRPRAVVLPVWLAKKILKGGIR